MSIKIRRLSSYISNQDIKDATKEDVMKSSAVHINDVQKGCAFMAGKMIEAGIGHDQTKISLIDKFFDEETGRYTGVKAHTMAERHHKVHLDEQCPEDVTLIDIIERIVDVVMAATARNGRVSDEPISSEILQKAYKNTFEMLKSEVVIEDDIPV